MRPWAVAPLLLAALAAGGPAAARNGTCEFAARGTMSLLFPTLDPSAAVTVVATATAPTVQVRNVGDCRVPLAVGVQSSTHFDGSSHRMKHALEAEYIPYTLTVVYTGANPPGNGRYGPITVQGSVAGSAYANVPAGVYWDAVVLQVTP